MAVRHGYGKIAGTDALVFAYDTGDTRNSYKGEPTENLALYSDLSAGNNDGFGGNFTFNSPTLAPDGKSTAYRWQSISGVSTLGRSLTLQENTTYTVSIYVKQYPGGASTTYFIRGEPGDYVTAGSGNRTITSEWTRISWTFTTSAGSTGTHRVGANVQSVGDAGFYYYGIQIEANSHATQYQPTGASTSTRSATQGLLDLTGNSTIDLSNVSFDNNAQMFFDGTNDHTDVGTGIISGTGDFTVEAVIQSNYQEVNGTILANYPAGNFQTFFSGRYIGLYLANSSAYLGSSPFTTVLPEFTTDPIHFLALREGTETRVYLNGVLKKTGSSSSTIGTTSTPFRVGANTNGGEDFLGQIFVVKAYSRALTADEVRNNYRHYKNRFNIS